METKLLEVPHKKTPKHTHKHKFSTQTFCQKYPKRRQIYLHIWHRLTPKHAHVQSCTSHHLRLAHLQAGLEISKRRVLFGEFLLLKIQGEEMITNLGITNRTAVHDQINTCYVAPAVAPEVPIITLTASQQHILDFVLLHPGRPPSSSKVRGHSLIQKSHHHYTTVQCAAGSQHDLGSQQSLWTLITRA